MQQVGPGNSYTASLLSRFMIGYNARYAKQYTRRPVDSGTIQGDSIEAPNELRCKAGKITTSELRLVQT